MKKTVAPGARTPLFDRIFKPEIITLENGHTVTRPRSRTPLIALLVFAALAISVHVTGFNLAIIAKRANQLTKILSQIFQPDPSFFSKVITPLLDTIKMSVMGSVIGCLLALPYAVAASANINRSKVSLSILRFILNIIRTLPTLVIASICALVFGLGTFAGTVAIVIFTFGVVTKMLYESIETINMGPFEALESAGADKFRAFWSAVFPQVLPTYLSHCLYSFEMNVRAASILGYVGAGGLGILIDERIGWRDYNGLGTVLLTLFVAVLLIENLSQFLRSKLSYGRDIMQYSNNILEKYESRPRKWWLYTLIVFIMALLLSWSASSVTFKGFAAKGTEVAKGIFWGLVKPDMNLLFSTSTDGVPYLLMETVCIAILGTVVGGILALPISFLASPKIMPKPVAFIFNALILLIRTLPSIVWALIWIRVTGPGAFCGVITQSICSIGMISKMYITAIADLDTSILESLDAAGCTAFQKIRYGIIPQLTPNIISTVIYRFDINIKDATTLGIVGAGGIGAALIQCINSRRWTMVGSFILAMIVLMLIIEFASTRIRGKLARGQ